MNKHRLAFIILSLGLIALIVLRDDERSRPLARAFGTACVIVLSVFVPLALGIAIAWRLRKRRLDNLYKGDPRDDVKDDVR